MPRKISGEPTETGSSPIRLASNRSIPLSSAAITPPISDSRGQWSGFGFRIQRRILAQVRRLKRSLSNLFDHDQLDDPLIGLNDGTQVGSLWQPDGSGDDLLGPCVGQITDMLGDQSQEIRIWLRVRPRFPVSSRESSRS